MLVDEKIPVRGGSREFGLEGLLKVSKLEKQGVSKINILSRNLPPRNPTGSATEYYSLFPLCAHVDLDVWSKITFRTRVSVIQFARASSELDALIPE